MPGFTKLLPPCSGCVLHETFGDTHRDYHYAHPLVNTLVSTIGRQHSSSVMGLAIDALPAAHMSSTVMPGVTSSNAIVSCAGTSTAVHIEDGGTAALNKLCAGMPKAWSAVSGAKGLRYLDLLGKEKVYDVLGKHKYGGLDVVLPDFMRGDEVVMVQHAGMTVVTLAGAVWHQTVSMGPSVAEAVNAWLGVDTAQPEIRAIKALWHSLPGRLIDKVENWIKAMDGIHTNMFDVVK